MLALEIKQRSHLGFVPVIPLQTVDQKVEKGFRLNVIRKKVQQ